MLIKAYHQLISKCIYVMVDRVENSKNGKVEFYEYHISYINATVNNLRINICI